MFTGIILTTGTVAQIKNVKREQFITIKTSAHIVQRVPEGGSVSVDGVCLTALPFRHPEPTHQSDLDRTVRGRLREGSLANARFRTCVRDSSSSRDRGTPQNDTFSTGTSYLSEGAGLTVDKWCDRIGNRGGGYCSAGGGEFLMSNY